MQSMESDSQPVAEPPDRTKWMWIGVGVLLVVLIVAMAVRDEDKPLRSEVRSRHILIKCTASDPLDRSRALERIQELKQRIDNGESFSKLAKQYSDDPYSAPKGGDLGVSKRGAYTEKFEDYVWRGPVGVVSDPIETPFGYHLILIEKRYLTDVDQYQLEQEQRGVQQTPPTDGE